jgi:hypothetical protein
MYTSVQQRAVQKHDMTHYRAFLLAEIGSSRQLARPASVSQLRHIAQVCTIAEEQPAYPGDNYRGLSSTYRGSRRPWQLDAESTATLFRKPSVSLNLRLARSQFVVHRPPGNNLSSAAAIHGPACFRSLQSTGAYEHEAPPRPPRTESRRTAGGRPRPVHYRWHHKHDRSKHLFPHIWERNSHVVRRASQLHRIDMYNG